MASSAPLADIEERFFHCSFCLEPFKDPKLLPCLHRYCRGCLGTIIGEKQDSFKCPLCREDCKIPDGREDGFKTDFHIKSVVDFLQLQTTFEHDKVRKCHGCKQTKTIMAYCFKCNDFLCDQCNQFHLNHDIAVEHRPHVLNLQNVDLRRLTLEKLASLTEHPRCALHAKYLTDLSCATCNNLPICVVCTYGQHKGHDINDIQVLAKSERKKLKAVILELNMYKDRLYELPKRVNIVREKLEDHVNEKVSKARTEHKRVCDEVAKKMEENKIELEKKKKEIKDRKENDCNKVKQECQEEMEKLKQRYDNIFKEREQKYDTETKQVEDKHGKANDRLSKKLERFKEELVKFEEEIEAKRVQNKEKCQEISDHSEHTINRYETFTVTTSTILASNHEWTDAQCLPAVTAASGPLLHNVKKEFPELDSLSETSVGDLLLRFVEEVTITEREETVVDINGVAEKGWQVYDITSSRDGSVIITGLVSDEQKSHITYITWEGELILQDKIEKVTGSQLPPLRYCERLSHSLIATVCQTNQVGLFDVSDGRYTKKDIKDINIKMPKWLTCVATDTMNNIYVGCRGRDVLIFDHKLDYQSTLRLPMVIKYPRDMTVNSDHLLVCDYSNRKASALTMDGAEARLVFEFPKPNTNGWRPRSVCVDTNEFTYILWQSELGQESIVTQYSRDGQQLVTTRKVDDDANCIATMRTGSGEKLLIATFNTAKLYTYGLITH